MKIVCNVCGQIKDQTTGFYKQASTKSGYHPRCKECMKKASRISEYKRRYGITPDQYDHMMKDQQGLCLICNQPETLPLKGRVRRMAVDHDHKTGEVRGLLCSDCNTGLGKFKDNPELLLSAIRYLQK